MSLHLFGNLFSGHLVPLYLVANLFVFVLDRCTWFVIFDSVCSVLYPRECHLEIQTLRSPFTCKRPRATTGGDTPLMPMSVVPNSHPRAEAVPAWRCPLRSAEQQGRSDALPVRQNTGTALRRHVPCILGNTAQASHAAKRPRACLVLRSDCERRQRCASNGTECHASKSARRLLRLDHQVFRLSLGSRRHGLHSIQCDARPRLEWQEFGADARC